MERERRITEQDIVNAADAQKTTDVQQWAIYHAGEIERWIEAEAPKFKTEPFQLTMSLLTAMIEQAIERERRR